LSHAFRAAALLHGVDFFGWRAMLSGAHSSADVDRTIVAVSNVIDQLREERLVP
jgi:hypothetical protein